MNVDNQKLSKRHDGKSKFPSVLEFFRISWRWLVGGCAIGLLSANGFLALSPAKFKAEVLIQPATVGVTFSTSSSISVSTPVEPIAQTLERLKRINFYGDDVVKECHALSAKSMVEEHLKARIARGSNLLLIEYIADSAANAEACLGKVVEQLVQSQAVVAAPAIKAMEDQLADTKRQIDSRERFLAQFEARGQRSISPTFTESILMILKSEELIKLQARYHDESRLLKEPLTQPVKLLEPIYSAQDEVYSRKLAVILVGLIGGLCLGALALLVTRHMSHFWKSKSQQYGH